ncbi:MAG TPA: DUF411 domain-containing protein [Gemmatimonadaceae bacterium]|nr:DUF411 domain-containing protein [Gemmatimonadaceae bacterium]
MTRMRTNGLIIVLAFAAGACTKQSNVSDADDRAKVIEPAAPGTASTAPAVKVASASGVPIKVYKDPNCGCCKAWIQHLEQNGFKVEVMDMPDLSAVKSKYGVKQELQACHTATVGDYTVEGHVPADLIHRMLKEKPAIAGLAVPGMPAGSPGMEGATRERYDILTFDRAGRTTVYAQR